MRKNGFTLIELLAVIVILAIIALIATPIILGIINDAREESNERSVELYANAIRNAVAVYELTHLKKPTSFDDLTIEYNGDIECTTRELYEDGKFYLDGCEVNGSEKEYSYGKKLGYTGSIYRNSAENLYMGNSINTSNRWCAVVPEVTNSCVRNGYVDMAFNSKAECETWIEQYANLGELSEKEQYFVEKATCEQGILTYETTPSNISKNYYLKHDIVNNEVTASYACITYTENGVRKDVCVRGGDSSYYESNQTTLRSIENYFNTLSNGYCYFSASNSHCNSSSLILYVESGGNLFSNGNSKSCTVYSDGYSYCKE